MKILARILLVSLMACPVLGFAQVTPLFQFYLYFEDSIGNKDSLIIGYDPSASSQNLNPQFGEVSLLTPFDSVFEVRATHGDDGQARTSKKIIEGADILSWDSCELPSYIKIVINTKFPPVKITYDSTLFQAETCRNVILSRDWNIFFLQEWWDVCEYHCMAGSSIFVEGFAPAAPPFLCWNYLFVEKEVEGQGLKSLPGLLFATFYGPGPCNDTTFLSTKDKPALGFGTLSPNPAQEYFRVQVPSEDGLSAYVSDVSGRLQACPFVISEGVAQFDTSQLQRGLYFVCLQMEGYHRSAVYKVVKI